MRSLAAVTFLSTFANAYKIFPAICTKPTDVVNYVSSTNTRSTLDIIWSCLLTIVACTWSVQHLNVPEEREGCDPGWMGNIKWTLKRSWKSTKWIVITIIAPEYLLMKNLGGALYLPIWEGTDASTLKSKFGYPFHINASELYRLPEAGILERLPFVSEEELLDKSKGDNFVRLITIAQILLWMVVQITAYGIRHVAISQSEVGVTAFAACAILIYAINWSRAKGVQTSPAVIQYDGEIPDEVIACISEEAQEKDFFLDFSGYLRASQRGSRIRNHYLHDPANRHDTTIFNTYWQA